MKNELGKAVQELERQKKILQEIEQERDEYITDINKQSTSGISVAKLKEYGLYISLLNKKVDNQKNNIKNAQESVDIYREKLVVAMRERKMMEKFREKKYEEYFKEQLRQEQKVIDEIASFNYEVNE